MAGEYIFQTYKLAKVHPPDREVLKDISLSFLFGAKIGVLGYNGAGKSSLLRDHGGPRPASSAAMPQLAPGAERRDARAGAGARPRRRTCARTCSTASGTCAALVERFNELAANYSDETADEFARLQEQIDAADAWNLDGMIEHAMDALRCPPGDSPVATLSGGERRRVALCRLLLSQPDLLLLDEPTNHLDAESVEWLERHLAEYKGTVVAVTHDRYFLDNVAGWILELDRGRGIPYQGNYSGWLEQKQERLAQSERAGARAPAHDRRRARMGAHEPEGPPHALEGAARELRGAARAGGRGRARPGPDPHPGRPAARRPRDRGDRPAQGLRRAAADRRALVLAAAAAGSSA